MDRRTFMHTVTAAVVTSMGSSVFASNRSIKHFIRFEKKGKVSYGLLENETVQELQGNLFDNPEKTGKSYPLEEVKLLVPCRPSKVLATAGNYASHLGETPKPDHPEIFIKSPSALLEPDGKIVIPPGTNDCHYEGEIIAVIGKTTKNTSVTKARENIFGVCCGNDVSARDWQQNDVQWWRAKASDTFAPVGPAIAVGANYDDLLLTTRLNGEVKQQQRTKDLIFSLPEIVSFISRHMTLLPGDLVYTGTPGQTSAMKSGDSVEVEIEDIGILHNTVA